MKDFSEIIMRSDFNPVQRCLVEASAGTGKTYNIQNVYLRLILEQQLSVDQILVVTFTEAATHELRERIRCVLSQAAAYFEGRLAEDDPDWARVDAFARGADNGAGLVRTALLNFDNATIFTIHGFCHRVLERNAFECGHDTAAELTAEDSELVATACRDWWRCNTYNNPDYRTMVPFEGLNDLAGCVEEYIRRPDALLMPEGGQKRIVEEIAVDIRRRKSDAGVLSYSDLLVNVRDALEADTPGARRLRAVLRQEYRAALIDEFQDTDPVQYAIFNRIFGDGSVPLCYVGDPKQSIYGFRGGDIFTYYRAKQAVGPACTYNLGTNYRSEENLVAAINEFFRDRPGAPSFINTAISYDGKLKAHTFDASKALLVGGQRDANPFRLWSYAASGRTIPGETGKVARQIYHDTAAEIAVLLNDQQQMLGGRQIKPSDIAVLVATHSEAGYIREELRRYNINAALQNSGNVFDAEGAKDMLLILRAMLEPGNMALVRGALVTRLLPCSDELLRETEVQPPLAGKSDTDEVPKSLDEWLDIFKVAGDLWQRNSFATAFGYLVQNGGIKRNIAKLDNGERRLTNLLQLGEIIHQHQTQTRQGPVGVMEWYAAQLDKESRGENDEYEMRLASDDDAVRIMTVFKSKGLQFPIVFVPTLWRRAAKATGRKMMSFHNADDELVLTFDTADQEARAAAVQEALEENLRLVYVALTRAINRLYVTTISMGEPEKYALQRLVGQWHQDARDETSRIEIVEVDEGGTAVAGDLVVPYAPAIHADIELITRDERDGRQPVINKENGHTSFSALEPEARAAVTVEARDVDAADADRDLPDTALATDIFSIPGGAITGNCFHDIFEHIDFRDTPENINTVVDELVARYGICRASRSEIAAGRLNAVRQMVADVLRAPLAAAGNDGQPFTLANISLTSRRSEMAFDFSLRARGECARIYEVLKKHWQGESDRQQFLEVLAGWNNPIPGGFMTGFIDLVFEHAGKFYIVDWKSNRRSGHQRDFGAEGIRDEMARHAYFLQYLIYTVALHGWLGSRMRGYDYEKHFGGVFYIFLRGVNGSGDGIFSDRPTRELIEELAEVLTGCR